jgi:hypothetical protein
MITWMSDMKTLAEQPLTAMIRTRPMAPGEYLYTVGRTIQASNFLLKVPTMPIGPCGSQ